ncbi:histidine phosphatase family protein [Candidatus Gracilibacteria bacterium CG17_big_fil_post_rev_8_21_14_2_50_48_13]|nr:MAG: histidine phosphatase family protein [Candidatus Gracilibacteria bacterium CG17_big_fil_post_rev_8_21_14_2_50_48_13]
MKLILVRHGQTEDNLTGTIQGHLPGKLTALGVGQARQVGERLATMQLDAIYSSDLQRAVDTAKEIAAFHPHVSFTLVQNLRERHLGSLEGMRREDLQGDVINLDPPDGESIQRAFARAKNFLLHTFEKHTHDTVLFVTHGFFSKCLFAALQNTDAEAVKTMDHFKNASISVFELGAEGALSIVSLNATDHLGS